MASSELGRVRRWVGASEAWVGNLIENTKYDPNIVVVVVLGSAVRDCGHQRSDVDLLVLDDQVRPKLRPPIEVDLRYQPAKDAEQLARSGHEILSWALKFGFCDSRPEGCLGGGAS